MTLEDKEVIDRVPTHRSVSHGQITHLHFIGPDHCLTYKSIKNRLGHNSKITLDFGTPEDYNLNFPQYG